MKRFRDALERLRAAIVWVLLLPLRAYSRLISPALPARCRYYPTCSEYAVQSIRELGPIRGSILAGWRLLRCNPFSHGGVDELSDRTLFRGTKTRSERSAKLALPPGGSNHADLA